MTEFDTLIRHGTIVTASDTFEADIGITDGKIQAIGRKLPAGKGAPKVTGSGAVKVVTLGSTK